MKINLDLIYPIGSIYMSVSTLSPDILFGGSWEKVEGRFLLGSSSKYTIEATGGEETHKLTVSEIPSHNHGIPNSGSLTPGYVGLYRNNGNDADSSGFIRKTGGDQPHNNMPPYLVVNIWKRIG